MQAYPLITVVGGSGFLGRHLIKRLARAEYRVRVLCRDTIAAEYLRPAGPVGQVVLQYADVTKPETLKGKFDGSFAVINLVGILHESGKQSFKRVQAEGAKLVAEAAKAAGAQKFIHVSALGVERAKDSAYARTKLIGEEAVKHVFPDASIVRPSLLIGQEDRFFQRFARMSMITPFLPLIGGGNTKFQPVLVTDVADAIAELVVRDDAKGKTFELAGPEVMSFKQMLEKMIAVTKRRTRLISIPTPLASLMGAVAELSPFPPPITRDQVKLLKYDNVAGANALGFASLNITPHSVSAELPVLLDRYVKE